MRFPAKDTLTDEEIQSGLIKNVTKDGLTSQTMAILTGGAFLVAFSLKLGASNLVIGLLAAIPLLTQLIQIPSIYLVEKIRNRRVICVYASAVSRVFWLLIALIPFLFFVETGLTFLIVALFLHLVFAAVGGASWNSWMRDLVPQHQLGSFFFFAFLIGIYSIHRLAMVKEIGEVKEKIVVHELIAEVRRGARSLSTVGGLRHLTQGLRKQERSKIILQSMVTALGLVVGFIF